MRLMPYEAVVFYAGLFWLFSVFCVVIPLPRVGMIQLINSALFESVPGFSRPLYLLVDPESREVECVLAPKFGKIKRGIK